MKITENSTENWADIKREFEQKLGMIQRLIKSNEKGLVTTLVNEESDKNWEATFETGLSGERKAETRMLIEEAREIYYGILGVLKPEMSYISFFMTTKRQLTNAIEQKSTEGVKEAINNFQIGLKSLCEKEIENDRVNELTEEIHSLLLSLRIETSTHTRGMLN